ncbi:hypothetical protein L1987_42729 [Smallanthus sonchifolius]|uniref:Uncharacterized protein n=1 Tax=Smallanthus sonchifolius TaxID=185202 RepID=A0ACB9GKE8_9ASTR|nr:hypothetical protein L1987_42729 [Smallanthus sonchifolius]
MAGRRSSSISIKRILICFEGKSMRVERVCVFVCVGFSLSLVVGVSLSKLLVSCDLYFHGGRRQMMCTAVENREQKSINDSWNSTSNWLKSLPITAESTATTSTANVISDPKRSKHKQQPLAVADGCTCFRLLCHSSRIGGVIGKSGAIIKQFR